MDALLAQTCRTKYRKIVETLGKEYLTNPRLRNRAYVFEDDGRMQLFEGISVATSET